MLSPVYPAKAQQKLVAAGTLKRFPNGTWQIPATETDRATALQRFNHKRAEAHTYLQAALPQTAVEGKATSAAAEGRAGLRIPIHWFRISTSEQLGDMLLKFATAAPIRLHTVSLQRLLPSGVCYSCSRGSGSEQAQD
jgi:hypothetical protein